MKIFNLLEQSQSLLSNPTIVNLLSAIEFNRGLSFNLPKRIKFNRLHDLSKRRSVTSSNEIEGIKINKSQEERIFIDKLDPETLEEKQLLGYNEALNLIFNSYKYQELDARFILSLHKKEWEILNPAYGGTYKDHQNYIREYFSDGSSRTVFIPSKPYETESQLENLVWQYNEAITNYQVNKLCLIFCFILDFLCIHPFNDGNGRVSRLLTTYLLLKSGYDLDNYYSTSYLVLKSLTKYYNSLEKSSIGWHENENDYSYFVIYQLNLILEGYRKLHYIFSINSEKILLKDKVKKIINESDEPISKGDIEEILFSNTRGSIEEALGKLVKENRNKKINNIGNPMYKSFISTYFPNVLLILGTVIYILFTTSSISSSIHCSSRSYILHC